MNQSPQFSVIADFVDQFFLGIPVSKLDLSKHKSSHHKMDVEGGILEKECSQILQHWFKRFWFYTHER